MSARALDWSRGNPTLMVDQCHQCNALFYLPMERCAACGSRFQITRASPGRGTCIAVTRLHVTADEADPVVLTLVELDEGPIVMGRADPALHVGDAVSVHFLTEGIDGALVPHFSRKV